MKNIKTVVHYRNDMVMVFDENCEQMSNYQGIYAEVKDKILRDAPSTAKFFKADYLKADNTSIGRGDF